jgi:purine-binding chemotaxis protein CheW
MTALSADRAGAPGAPASGTPVAGAPEHWLSFHLDGGRYAVPLAQVSEVIRVGELTAVPGAAVDLLGVRHLRGQIVAVLDGRRRLGLPGDSNDDSRHARIIVMVLGHQWVGLRVDAVGELLLVGGDALAEPPPGRPARTDDPVRGVLAWQGEFIALLDTGRLCRLPGATMAS